MNSAFRDRLLSWMYDNRYVVGLDAKNASQQKDKAVKIASVASTLLGMVIHVPLTTKLSNAISKLRGDEDDFKHALAKLIPLCDVLGTRPIDGRVIAAIDADRMSPDEIEARWTALVTALDSFRKLLPLQSPIAHIPCCFYPISVWSNGSRFDAAVATLLEKGWRKTGTFGALYFHAGFVDTAGKRLVYSDPKGVSGAIYNFATKSKAMARINEMVFDSAYYAFPSYADLFE